MLTNGLWMGFRMGAEQPIELDKCRDTRLTPHRLRTLAVAWRFAAAATAQGEVHRLMLQPHLLIRTSLSINTDFIVYRARMSTEKTVFSTSRDAHAPDCAWRHNR